MSPTKDPRSQASARVDELKKLQPEIGELLDYCGALLAAQAETRASFRPGLERIEKELRSQRSSAGLPLLAPEDVRVDWALFDDLLARVLGISREHQGVFGDEVSLPDASAGFEAWREGLVAGFLSDSSLLDRAAERAGVERGLFEFLAHQALAPFLEAYAEGLKADLDAAGPLKGRCPTCGAPPLMGRLDEEAGKRHLQCWLCRTDWAFKRIGCPFCGNDDQQKLRMFSAEGDEAHRVEVCDRCKTYIKVVDTRKVNREVFLPLEYVFTIHLDPIAGSEGFEPGARGLPGAPGRDN